MNNEFEAVSEIIDLFVEMAGVASHHAGSFGQ